MFTLSTDSSCDIFRDTLRERNIEWIPLTFTIDGETFEDNFTTDGEVRAFYDKIRAGAMPITSQINAFLHEEYFGNLVERGCNEILHFSLSSGMSNTFNSAREGANKIMEKNPSAKIYVIDTLGATQGARAIVEKATAMRDEGLSIAEAAAKIVDFVSRLHHWVVVDDLKHLSRGGRVSNAAAFVGSLLNIKPILIINKLGQLEVVHKSKGAIKGMTYVLDQMEKYGKDIANQTVYIAHADSMEKANVFAELIRERFSCKIEIGWIGAVIGSHTGAGTVGLVFEASSRL